ncbi:MAG: hypothetical protein CMF96_10650 [Candidatus Marinimicrobia bacterium]|nr:hypothetical protein [Candidatus Neomarinimicrobiota bacterium]|tara:strand:+ start:310 stop:1260 length:951 start_codon:yes stop_codon:yes gene_type:complete
MKQAIVTGATGFIGSAFVELLINKNIQVLSLGRKPFDKIPKDKKKKLSGSLYLNLDMKNISNLRNEINKLDWIIGNDCVFFNLAWGGKERLSDLDVEAQIANIGWCVNAIKVAKEICCKRFIQVGTMEELFTHKYLGLNHHTNDEYNRHVIYSVAKISAKFALELYSSLLEMELIYVINSHVIGPNDDKDSFLQVTLEKMVKNEDLVFSSGEQYFDTVSLDDCVFGYYLICKKGRSGSNYWVGSGEPCRIKDYVKRMSKLFSPNKNLQFGKLPYNDIMLNPEDFSVDLLTEHTGYKPKLSFEQTIIKLYENMFDKK